MFFELFLRVLTTGLEIGGGRKLVRLRRSQDYRTIWAVGLQGPWGYKGCGIVGQGRLGPSGGMIWQ